MSRRGRSATSRRGRPTVRAARVSLSRRLATGGSGRPAVEHDEASAGRHALEARVGRIDEAVDTVRRLGLLVDRDEEGYLLQRAYQTVTITGTGSLRFANPHAGGTVVVLRVAGDVRLDSTA